MQRKLGTLAHASAKNSQTGNHQQPVRIAIDLLVGRLDPLSHVGCGDRFDHARRRGQREMVVFGADLAEDAPLRDFNLSIAVGVDVAEGKRAQAAEQRHQPDNHAEVADPIDDERLVRRRRGALALDIKADQEIRADADQFPEHEDHRHVAGDHDAQHAKAKQRQVLEKAVKSAVAVQVRSVGQPDFVIDHVMQFVVHVAIGIKMDARGNHRDH